MEQQAIFEGSPPINGACFGGSQSSDDESQITH